jgi:hypothetical protein
MRRKQTRQRRTESGTTRAGRRDHVCDLREGPTALIRSFAHRGPSIPPRCPLSHCKKASVGRVINCLAASQLRIARLMLRFFGTYGDAIHADYLDSGQDCEER